MQWLIGLTATSVLVLAGMLIAAFRNVYWKISRRDSALHKRIDEVKDGYVRQDHLDSHVSHLDRRLDDMIAESRGRHAELKELVRNALR